MEKLDGKLDGITTTVNSIDSLFKSMEERVDGIVNHLGKAEGLFFTVDDEMQVAKTEHTNFWDETVSRLDTLEEM